MAEYPLSSQQEDKYHVNFINCNVQTLVVGDKSTVNVPCRRLEYPEQSTASRSGGIQRTAIQDGGESRGTKRKQSKITFSQRKCRPDPKLWPNRGSSESEEENDVEIQDLPNSNASELDRNQGEKDVVRSEPLVEPSNAMEPGDRESVDEKTQNSARPVVTNNITIRDSDIVVLGDNTKIYLQNSDEMFTSDFQRLRLEEALSFYQHRVVVLPGLPLRSELSQLPAPGVDPRVRKVFNKMGEIVNQLYPLRDCGKWQEFGDALNRLHQKYGSIPEINCFLLLEESVKLTYQKRLKEAREKAEQSLDNVYNEANKIDGVLRNVLRALANIALASIYRRLPKQKLGKAFQCLQNAMESGEQLKRINLTIPAFVLALLEYEHARSHMEFPAVKCDSKCCNREPSKFLGLCIDRCRTLSGDNQLYTAKHIFALINLANLSLPSATRQSQPGQIIAERQCDTRQAEKHLEEYERSHSHAEGSPVAAGVKYLMTKSEVCFLKMDYTGAKDYVRQAIGNAIKYGFELETVPAQNYLDHICRCCASITAQDNFQKVKDLSSSYSSSTTTDSDQKYNVKASQRAT